ncbi:MAG: hypothetical protein GY830_07900 [Bacteroidetes bacterium]|nr:hypothetical protein [Bacteroidota bacterium]
MKDFNFNELIKIFSVLGEKSRYFKNNNFIFNLVPNWETPSFSPILLIPGETLEKKDLEYVENYFKNHPIINSAVEKTPYFNFIKGEKDDIESIKLVCKKFNWSFDPAPLRINILEKPIAINMPSDFSFTVYKFSKINGLVQEYKDIVKTNFDLNEQSIKFIEDSYKNKKAKSYTVLINTQDRQCVGGGTVSIYDQRAFFTWGSINKLYRGKGFHQLLLAVCKMIATSYGIDTCAYATRNKFIKNKCDSYIEMYICRKK